MMDDWIDQAFWIVLLVLLALCVAILIWKIVRHLAGKPPVGLGRPLCEKKWVRITVLILLLPFVFCDLMCRGEEIWAFWTTAPCFAVLIFLMVLHIISDDTSAK